LKTGEGIEAKLATAALDIVLYFVIGSAQLQMVKKEAR
jgi:hypothetical protein